MTTSHTLLASHISVRYNLAVILSLDQGKEQFGKKSRLLPT